MSKGCTPISIHDFRELKSSSVSAVDIAEEYIRELISEGWIEEVKPREFWVIQTERSGVMACDDKVKAYDLADEINHQKTEIIKVREVIE